VVNQHTETSASIEELSFESLWERYHKPLTWFVSGYLRHLHDGDPLRLVEDAVQEILLRIYRRLDEFDCRHRTSTWIYSIARNYCIDLLRRHRVRRAHLVRCDNPDHYSCTRFRGPEEAYLEGELHARVGAFIASLEPDDRTMLMLRFYEDLSYSEIGRSVSRPEGTVKYRIHEIKRRLKEHLEATYE
jgi:RNA polymerase sigma-70 factor, ECF subfamily